MQELVTMRILRIELLFRTILLLREYILIKI